MSKSSKVNLQYLYNEENIDFFVRNTIKHKLGGFKKDEHAGEYKFLLNKKFGVGNNSYYVLYSGAINSAGKLSLNFFFDELKQPTHERRDDWKDVFDELIKTMLLEKNCKAKLLFPYNITSNHWLTGETVINKTNNDVTINIYTHDPYGGGQLSKKNFSILKAAFYKIIEESDLQVASITTPASPFTNARQTMADDTSCAIIVADELVKRITDNSLNISSPYPKGAEQLRLSQLTFLKENLGKENQNYQHFKQQVTLKVTRLEENVSINLIDYVASPTIEQRLTIGEIREKVKQIVCLEDINESKIVQLKLIEEEQYKSLIQQLAYKTTLEELKDLVIVLNDLGLLTTKLGELSNKLKYYTDSAVLYQYIITILDERLNEKLLSTEDKHEFLKQEKINPYQQLNCIQQLIFSVIGGDQEKMLTVQKEATTNKQLLTILRENTDFEMQVIEAISQKANTDNREYNVNAAKALFEKIAIEIKKFLAKLYSDSEQQMTITPPCKYAIIGLGSMALKQITPYSDLEFAILTADEEYKKNNDPKVREYFKNLSHLLSFKIINLGESIIPISKYGLDMSHLVRAAVNFDLGGKTPLGRIDGGKPYDLIKTVDWMLYYVRNEEDKASHIDKNLPYILENVCYVYGDKELVKRYQDKVVEFLHDKSKDDPQGRLNCEIRAIKLLKEGAVEFEYLQKVQSLQPKKKFQGDLDKLAPSLTNANGRLFDVKQEIYRLPDRMIYNLGLFYGIKGDCCWDTVDRLVGDGIITIQAAFNLKNAITFANTIRLKTYAHHKAQKEGMSIFFRHANTESKKTEQATQMFHLSEQDLKEQGGLFQYFYTALPLHKKLEEFCRQYKDLNNASKQAFFQNTEFYKDDCESKGIIHYRLAQYEEATTNLERALEDPNNNDNLQIRETLGKIYYNFGNTTQAIELYKRCLSISIRLFNDQPYLGYVGSLYSLGAVYNAQGDYDQAINYCQDSLKKLKMLHKRDQHLYTARTLNTLGIAYGAKEQFKQSIRYHKESLKIKKLIYKEEPHLDVVESLNNLGEVYRTRGNYDQAIKYYEESLKMSKLFFQDEPHPAIAASLGNLGNVFSTKGQLDQAINYYEESLKIKKLFYKDQNHPDVASLYQNLGMVYKCKGQYNQAINYYIESLQMYKSIYQGKPNPSVVDSLISLADVYRETKQYDQVIKYLDKSVKMSKLIYQDEPHSKVAASLTILGTVSRAKGQYDQAINYYNESLKIYKLIYKDHPQLNVAISLNNLGNVYGAKGQYDQAINFLEKSLNIKKLIYQDQAHPELAESLHNLGVAYATIEDYKQALGCSIQAFQMICVFHDHPHKKEIQSFMVKVVTLFAETYSLNNQEIENRVFSFSSQGLDFTDYKLHYNSALLQGCRNERKRQVAELILEYRLAIIFLPKEQSVTKIEICSKLADLTGEENIELWLAIAENDKDKVNKLAAVGVNLDHAPFINTTPLTQAVIKGNIDMVSALISGRADINKPNNDQDQITPLYYSLAFDRQLIKMELVEFLLSSGADANKPMFDGDSPMHMAHYSAHKKAIKLLLQYGANINIQNAKGKTPLHCLLEKQDINSETKIEIVQEFIAIYDLSTKDHEGKTVEDYTKQHCPEQHCPELLQLFAHNVKMVGQYSIGQQQTTKSI